MKRLNKKVFYTIFCILSIGVFSFIVLFNVQRYVEEENAIINSLDVVSDRKKNDGMMMDNHKPMDDNIKFMDYVIYTVLIDDNNNIKEIINHSNNMLNSDDVTKIANSILSDSVKEKYVGNLYFSKYAYSYRKGDALIILDTNDISSDLLFSLEISLIIFGIIEVVIFLVSKVITNWITKPVSDSFERQKQFIADASHELKTPLSVIIASTDALEETPSEKKWLTNIKNESERMKSLITDLLDLAASENKETFRLENGDLSKTILFSVLTFEGKAFENKLKLDYDIPDDINMNMDENSIKQLVEILLDNAISHSKKNGIINVKLREDSNMIEFLVMNEGTAIPKGEEEKIFERFYRIDKARNRNENRYGLGLAIAKNIVINHNGKISCSSDDGVTTFRVLFKK